VIERVPAAPAVRPDVELRPITDDDVGRVGQFLTAHLNQRVPPTAWARAMETDWHGVAPNHGYLLEEAGSVVGAYVAYYTRRQIGGAERNVCNLGAWCVVDSHRFHSLRLLKALLAQPGFDYFDLSPSGNVIGLNKRLGFTSLDTSTALIPNLPWPSWPGRTSISSDTSVIAATLTNDELLIYRDHVNAAAAKHFVVRRGQQHCYVIFRRDRRKGMPGFASLLYVSNPALFRHSIRPIARTMLLRHRVLATLAELRLVGGRPNLSVQLRTSRPKMFKSADLTAEMIDYLYSELVLVPW
jgi:hypothetical protein